MTPAESGITSLDVPPGITSRLSRPRLLPKEALNPLMFFSALRPIIYFSSRQRASLPAVGKITFALLIDPGGRWTVDEQRYFISVHGSLPGEVGNGLCEAKAAA